MADRPQLEKPRARAAAIEMPLCVVERAPELDLTPELREFLDRVIVPLVVRDYLAETAADTPIDNP